MRPLPPPITAPPVNTRHAAAPDAPGAATSAPRWRVGTLAYTTAGLTVVIFWLLVGDVGISIRDRSYGSGFSLLLRQLKASNTALSFLMTILPRCIALVFGPMISFKSDRLRSRWGRRIPFLLFAAPPGTMAMLGIAFTPRLGVQLHEVLGPHSPGLRQALTLEETRRYQQWVEDAAGTDIAALNGDHLHLLKHQLNRPISRIIDADPRFTRFLDHPLIEPFLVEFLGADYRHIDNDLYDTPPGYAGGGWHRGVRPHPSGHVVGGKFVCPMVKVFFCMTDVGPGQGEFVVVPGSHRAAFEIESSGRIDLPGQHVFGDVSAGDITIFNEAVIHNGRPNLSSKTRKTIIFNFGRCDAGVWNGYAPAEQTLRAASPRQREILSNWDGVWRETDALTLD